MIPLHAILTINITTVKLITRGRRGIEIDYIILCEQSQTKHTILTYFTTSLLYFNIFSTRNWLGIFFKCMCTLRDMSLSVGGWVSLNFCLTVRYIQLYAFLTLRDTPLRLCIDYFLIYLILNCGLA